MSRVALRSIAIAAGCMLAGCGGGEPAGTSHDAVPAAPATRRTIAVIPKGTTHVFWTAVERGAREAGEELGVEVLWKGPLKENDRAQQIQLVESFVGAGVDGIVLAPLDHRALVRPVQEAGSRGIPVVVFDSALDGEAGRDFVSLVATDNVEAGRMGGEHLARLLPEGGKVVLLRYLVGSASTAEREKGFLDGVSNHPGVEVIVENRYAGATAGEAKTQALNMIERLREADGIFCPNESSTHGMLLALRQEGLAGTVRFVGFDASPPLVEALSGGEIDALVVQDPRGMGHRAVAALVSRLEGRAVAPFIDTGAVLVTRSTMDDPRVRRLIE
jgi:ribose transport system substrate-binding protein